MTPLTEARLAEIRGRCKRHGPLDGDVASFATEAHGDRIALLAHVEHQAAVVTICTALSRADRIDKEERGVDMDTLLAKCAGKKTLREENAELTAEVARLQAALRQAEGERLDLATVVLRKCGGDLYSSRITIDAAVKLAKRIVAAANGGRDGGWP